MIPVNRDEHEDEQHVPHDRRERRSQPHSDLGGRHAGYRDRCRSVASARVALARGDLKSTSGNFSPDLGSWSLKLGTKQISQR